MFYVMLHTWNAARGNWRSVHETANLLHTCGHKHSIKEQFGVRAVKTQNAILWHLHNNNNKVQQRLCKFILNVCVKGGPAAHQAGSYQ